MIYVSRVDRDATTLLTYIITHIISNLPTLTLTLTLTPNRRTDPVLRPRLRGLVPLPLSLVHAAASEREAALAWVELYTPGAWPVLIGYPTGYPTGYPIGQGGTTKTAPRTRQHAAPALPQVLEPCAGVHVALGVR
eukprot:scaffold61776_cov60-Phaeocystis_antarctica.AAC.1